MHSGADEKYLIDIQFVKLWESYQVICVGLMPSDINRMHQWSADEPCSVYETLALSTMEGSCISTKLTAEHMELLTPLNLTDLVKLHKIYINEICIWADNYEKEGKWRVWNNWSRPRVDNWSITLCSVHFKLIAKRCRIKENPTTILRLGPNLKLINMWLSNYTERAGLVEDVWWTHHLHGETSGGIFLLFFFSSAGIGRSWCKEDRKVGIGLEVYPPAEPSVLKWQIKIQI